MSEIDALLTEDRRFPPSAAFRAAANVSDPEVYARAARDPEAFWAGFARELEWMRPWDSVLKWDPPNARWFDGGTLNASANCLDRHVRSARRNKAAIIWEGEPGDRRTLTYWDLFRQVSAFANVLKSLGVKRGDRVALYLPLIPELAISMLACARIGAVHNVVFGGFSAESLRDRINDCQAVLLVTADGGYRRGQVVPLKQTADEALRDAPSIKNVVVVQRQAGAPIPVEHRRRPGSVVSPPDAARRRGLRAGSHERGGHALRPLHVRHDRQAEGHRAHDGRVSHRLLRDDEMGVRPQGGRRLLVHRRHRVGDRPQLRRLRAALEWSDRGDVRRRAGLAARRTASGS